jgi:hypothetical protein
MSTINPNYVPASFIDSTTGNLTVTQSQAQAVSGGIQARLDQMPPAEDAAFLVLLQQANLSPADLDTPEELDAVLNRFQTAAETLVEALKPTGTGSAAYIGSTSSFLARALIEFAAEQRKNALDERMNARETAQTQLKGQANEMREAADKIMGGAILNLVMTVVMSAVSIGMSIGAAVGNASATKEMVGGLKEMKSTAADAENFSKAAQIHKANPSGAEFNVKADAAKAKLQVQGNEFTTISQGAQKYTSINTVGQAMTQLGSGVGNSGNSIMQAQSKEDDAQAAEAAAAAQYAEGQADINKDLQNTMSEFIKTIINFLKELKEAEVDQMRALTKV